MAGGEANEQEQAILQRWAENAAPWASSVRAGSIASRRAVTDRAVIEAVLRERPAKVLDVGCGEGWLVRALSAQGLSVLGVDAVPALIESARAAGPGEYRVVDYAELGTALGEQRFELAVCNFSLLGDASVRRCLGNLHTLLSPGGRLLIQTLHPWSAGHEAGYRDGWVEGSWAGCGEGYGEPAPWFYRTLSGWVELLVGQGFSLARIDEPLWPDSERPASLLITACC